MCLPRAYLLVFLWILVALFAAPVEARSITMAVVVARDDSRQEMSRKLLARIYRRQIRLSRSGERISPVNLPATHPLRRAFSRTLFSRRPEDMVAFWSQSYFHGVSPPYVLQSQEAVLRFVSHTPGAIGYVAQCRVDPRVKVLLQLVIENPEPGLLDDRICAIPSA